MLTIALARLEREGSLEIEAEIPADDPSWEGTELRFSAPLSVSGKVQWVTSGEVVALLRLEGRLIQDCRRCLDPVNVTVHEDVNLVYSPVDESWEGDDDTYRPLPEGLSELDLKEAIREEVILSQSPLALCRDDCRGLCPQCGANLNEDRCECSKQERDPRWGALRALKEDRE